MMVEQARLRVGELRERMPDGSPEQLDAIERELGMVGYLVSENLVAEARRELLAQARRSCRAAGSDRDAAAELSQLLAGLDRELGCAIAVRAHATHASQAADHLADVRELLADALGSPPAHASASTDGPRAAPTSTPQRHHATPTGTSD